MNVARVKIERRHPNEWIAEDLYCAFLFQEPPDLSAPIYVTV